VNIKQKQGPRAKLTVRMARTLANAIKAEAGKLNISENEWILRQLNEALK
jgi:predicted HicB family RNase H-like nuclease